MSMQSCKAALGLVDFTATEGGLGHSSVTHRQVIVCLSDTLCATKETRHVCDAPLIWMQAMPTKKLNAQRQTRTMTGLHKIKRMRQ